MRTALLTAVLLATTPCFATASSQPADPAASEPSSAAPRHPSLEYRFTDAMPYDVPSSTDDKYVFGMTLQNTPGFSEFIESLGQGGEKYVSSSYARQVLHAKKAILNTVTQPLFGTPNNALQPLYQGRPAVLQDWADVWLSVPTIEQGKQLVPALIEAYRAWWQDNGRQYLEAQLGKSRKDAQDVPSKMEQTEKQRKADEATVNHTYVSWEQVRSLQARQMMLEVDLAGTNTKIEAAEKLLQDPQVTGKHSAQWQEQLELVKTTAQIDLAGLLAQKGRIGSLIPAYERLLRVDDDLKSLRERKDYFEKHIIAWQTAMEALPVDPDQLAVSHAVLINQIDWDVIRQKQANPSGSNRGGNPSRSPADSRSGRGGGGSERGNDSPPASRGAQ